jgi:hypothetical protein
VGQPSFVLETNRDLAQGVQYNLQAAWDES